MPSLPSFVDLLAPERFSVRVEAASKDEMIERCAAQLAESDVVDDPALLVADLRVREATLSTGVGEGLALPHTRTDAVTGTAAALATLATPIEWDAIDGQPVDLVVLFAGPKGDRAAHVRLLAQISRVLSAPGVRQRLAEAPTVEAALDALRAAEEQ